MHLISKYCAFGTSDRFEMGLIGYHCITTYPFEDVLQIDEETLNRQGRSITIRLSSATTFGSAVM